MDSIILAGGLGTRLREIVSEVPKPLAPIQGTPFLDLLLNQLKQTGMITRAVLAMGYKAESMVDYYQKNPPPLPIDFSIETSPLGTGGAVKLALSHTCSKHVLVLNGDSYLDFSLEALLERHLQTDADLTIAYTEVNDASRYGKLLVDSKTHKILSFCEKSPEIEIGPISAGVYLIQRETLLNLPWKSSFSLEKEGFPLLLKGKMYGCLFKGTFIDIGTPESYFEAQKLLSRLL